MNDDTDKAALELEVILNWLPGQDIVRAFVDNRPFVMKSEKIPAGSGFGTAASLLIFASEIPAPPSSPNICR